MHRAAARELACQCDRKLTCQCGAGALVAARSFREERQATFAHDVRVLSLPR